ncbi:IucA/IucC family siderophore biosynthesis protein [Paraburkholderia sp. RG36]|uniref:IucA/IucC family siderophore biosynthesis protein n=2 Tax=Paraburkholderia tagetis TaxID=2913261 RepID=A0A9X1UHQ4_9BURK|nr:IucA/IucC family siderophore biosynthesis protein [Paraburkholderia tagetis]MCG5076884.1 IucA/IucC family siderophore biosynthesis protein [Paraburkholderia tagetis]
MQHTLLAPHEASAHLTPEVWCEANRMLVRKAIAEYAHELIVEPLRTGDAMGEGYASYELESDDGTRSYTFEARLLALRHWSIRPETIVCTQDGAAQPLDALAFILDVKARLGIKEAMLPIYLDEISSTLYGAAYKTVKAGPDTPELLSADFQAGFQAIETAMSEGHPGFVANNGRLGFDAGDYRAYAPEAASTIQVIWLAVHKDNAAFHCAEDLDYARLMDEELGAQAIARFRATVASRGCDFDDYRLMPAHPWQWFNKLSIAFAAYVATNRIICLGYGDDRYLAQQSIRTFFNVSDRSKRYVKTSLSILNMGFMRGLSPYYMSGTPAINDFIKSMIANDPYLQSKGFTILREVASMGFRNRYYEAAVQADTPYKKMLSALWRENPLALAGDGQRLMTMAALLHTDRHGRALLPALIEASGLGAERWLERYLDAYLAPLVHCFYAHDLVFMPHGENLILVLENHVPVRAIMKDIAEESAILNKDAKLPENVKRLAVDVPENVKLLAIFIDVFDGFFRYVNQILVEHGCCSEDVFWNAVARSVARYQAEHPELAQKFAEYDLFAPEFLHSCLNRLQLGNNVQMVNLADPAGNLKMAGNLRNPLAGRRDAQRALLATGERAAVATVATAAMATVAA